METKALELTLGHGPDDAWLEYVEDVAEGTGVFDAEGERVYSDGNGPRRRDWTDDPQ